MEKNIRKWEKSNKDIKDYPIGTKFRCLHGGYWIKVNRGFRWFCGDTFPRPGADWDGYVSVP